MTVFSKEELEKLAKEKINEDIGRQKDDIRAIKYWMKKQPHLKDGRMGTFFLESEVFRLNE